MIDTPPDSQSLVTVTVKACPAPAFKKLTYPRFRPLLTDKDPEQAYLKRLVIGAVCGDKPVGLALFSPPADNAWRRLLSIFVARPFRRQGIGLKLLAEGERAAMDSGTKTLIAFHSNRTPNYAWYEGLMQKAGWSNPELLEFRAGGKAKWVYRAELDWEKFLIRIKRGGFATTCWTELTDADRKRMASVVADELPEADRGYDPLTHKLPNFLPEISVVLRCGKEIAGWVLGSKGEIENTCHYTHGYALPKYQKRGYLIAGMWEVCRRQAELFGPETLSTYETKVTGLHRIMQRMMPYTDWTDERFACEKILR